MVVDLLRYLPAFFPVIVIVIVLLLSVVAAAGRSLRWIRPVRFIASVRHIATRARLHVEWGAASSHGGVGVEARRPLFQDGPRR